MNQNRLDLVRYLTENGKNETWQEIGDRFGITARQARYWWESYSATPTSEDVENGLANANDVEDVTHLPPTDVPQGMRCVGMTVNASGSRSYRYKPLDMAFDASVGLEEALRRVKIRPIRKTTIPQPHAIAINIADVHVGMSTDGTLFDQEWCLTELYKRLDIILEHVPNDVDVYLNILGDYADGERGKTASNSHKLQQNMDDQEIFSHGVEALLFLTRNIHKKIKGSLTVNMITNSNHPTVVDYNIARTLQYVWEQQDKEVKIRILDEVYNPIKMEDHYFILTHGKDRKFMKRGLPKFLGNQHILGIERLMDFHNIKRAVMLRGDLHQYVDVEYPKFRDIMTPSLAPPSGWISANFLSNDLGGFTILDLGETLRTTLIKFGE